MCDDEVINIIETKYPETCQEFKRIQKYQYLTFCKKQLDYGPGNISLGSTLETFDDTSVYCIIAEIVNNKKWAK